MIHPLAALIAGVKVKPLEWPTEPRPNGIYRTKHDGTGIYYLMRVHTPARVSWRCSEVFGWNDAGSEDAAKAAAQADYEARILAALEAATPPDLVEAHDEQLGVWADELMADLVLNGLMDLSDHEYDTKVGARREIIAALKQANQAKVPQPDDAPVPDLVEAGKVLEGVTPGPWVTGAMLQYTVFNPNTQDDDDSGVICDCQEPNDARFIAWCREGVPALIALCQAQAAQIAGLEAKARESAMQELASLGQAQEAYEAQLASETEAATLRAEVERLRGAVRWAHDTLWEINPSNYDHDDVCKLNDASVEVILGIAPLIGETHGKSPEWWAARAALEGKADE